MKKLSILALIFCSSLSFAQIGINKTNIDPHSAFQTAATNQGVLIPRIPVVKNLTDKTFLNDPTSVPAGLLIFCEGRSGGIGSGYYIWQNDQWNYALDFKNIQNRLDITRLYTKSTSGSGATAVTQFYKNSSINNGDDIETPTTFDYKNPPSQGRWTAIDNTEVNFQINQLDNSISIGAFGNAQTGSNPYVISTTDGIQSRTIGFNVGVFIKKAGNPDTDYKIYAVTTISSSEKKTCLILPFNVSSVIKLDEIGAYTAKIYVMGRRNFINKTNNFRADYYYSENNSNNTYGNSGNFTYLMVGGRSTLSGSQYNTACTNSDQLNMRATINLLVSEVTPKN